MSQSKKKIPLVVTTLTAVLVLIALALIIGGKSGDPVNAGDPPIDLGDDAIVQTLTVKTVSVNCLELTGSTASGMVPLEIGALERPSPDGPRLWGDSLSTPLNGDDSKAKMDDFASSICEDPLLGNTWGHFLAGLTVDGRKLVDLNPWLAKYSSIETDKISVRAEEFIPLLDVTDPSDKQIQTALTKNREWASEAEWLISLIERFSFYGEGALPSVLNYHLAGGGLVVGKLPVVEINPDQENLPALVLFVSKKGACAPIKLIGINVGDRRPEEFAPPVCETTSTTTPCVCSTTSSVPSTTTPCNCSTSTTTTVVTSTTTVVTTTTVPHGKPGLPTTVAPPPLTAPPTPTTAPSGPTTSVGDSGVGAPTPATTVAPTPTVAPPATNPTSTTTPPGPGVTVTLP